MGIFLAGEVEYDRKIFVLVHYMTFLTTARPLEWGKLGNEGWNYNTTLKYFKKATNISVAPEYNQKEEHATFDPQYHGTKGVSFPRSTFWGILYLPTSQTACPCLLLWLVQLGDPTFLQCNGFPRTQVCKRRSE